MTERAQIVVFAVAAIFVIIVGLVIFGPGRRPPSPTPAEIVFWGIEEPEVYSQVITEFTKELPHLSVKYKELGEATYENELINRLAGGAGPDVFMLKSTWVKEHQDKVVPVPQALKVTPSDFKSVFVDVAARDLVTREGAILGLPLSVDTPALFYNKDIFNSEGIASPPQTWEEILAVSQKITRLSAAGDLIRSGVALGTADNVENWFEILSSIFLQQGVSVVGPDNNVSLGENAASALGLYTSFSDQTKTNFSWSSRMPNSLESFAKGNAAIVFGFPEDLERIRAQNPRLNFGVSEFPQPQEASKKIAYGSYFFPTVSRQSRNQQAAWQFVLYLVSRGSAEKYLASTKHAPARRDLIGQGAPQDSLGVFYRQSLFAQSWPVPDEARIASLLSEAIRSVNTRAADPKRAIQRLEEQLRLLVR